MDNMIDGYLRGQTEKLTKMDTEMSLLYDLRSELREINEKLSMLVSILDRAQSSSGDSVEE